MKCEGCGASFVKTRPAKRFCSDRCRRRAEHARWRKTPAGRQRERERERLRNKRPEQRARLNAKTRRYYWKHTSLYRTKQRRRQVFQNTLKLAARMMRFKEALEEPMKETVLEKMRSKAKEMPTLKLKDALARSLELSRTHLLWQAAIVHELEARGEVIQTADSMRPYLAMLRQIADGKLLVDTVIRFAGRPHVMAKVARFPVSRQKRLACLSDDEVDDELPRKSKLTMARHAAPGDVAEMCLELVNANDDPQAVASCLIPQLQRVKQGRSKLQELLAV